MRYRIVSVGHPSILRRLFHRLPKPLRRFLRGEGGSELVQFVMVLPLLLALFWTSFEIWQLMSLRSALRTTAAQAARYVTAFALPDGFYQRHTIPPVPVCEGMRGLVLDSLSGYRGILGDRLGEPEITLYWIRDPSNPAWEDNVEPGISFADCSEFLNGLKPDDPMDDGEGACDGRISYRQFGIKLQVEVPWLTVLFRLGGTVSQRFTLRLADTAVGAITCFPACCDEELIVQVVALRDCTPDNCTVSVRWDLGKCDFVPRMEFTQGTIKLLTLDNPQVPVGQADIFRVHAPEGELSSITVSVIGRQRLICSANAQINRQ